MTAGVVPPDHNEIPNTITDMIGKYDKLEFEFADPNVEFIEDLASVFMRLEIYGEVKAVPPEPAKKLEIIVDGRLDLRKENGEWKIIYWELIPPFQKFEESPL